MPLTEFQTTITALLSKNRSPDSYLSGGSALHLEPNTTRYSNDLDYFHDSEERVAEAFEQDKQTLESRGFSIVLNMNQPGYVRAVVKKDSESTKIEWAHDSAWRFLPVVFDERVGYQLHPIDLAINKVLALVGRDEPRDFLDTLHCHQHILSLGALCWAAAGKDPGYTAFSLLELLKRRGKYQQQDFERMHLAKKIDLPMLKNAWREALDQATAFVSSRPSNEHGCLYFSIKTGEFISPCARLDKDVKPHFGRPGGVLPAVLDT